MPPDAFEIPVEESTTVRQYRRAFRRVFMPMPTEAATPEDRKMVLEQLDAFCCLNAPFKVDMGASDVGLQLAVQEGRRTVLLFIRRAIEKSYEEQRKNDTGETPVIVE